MRLYFFLILCFAFSIISIAQNTQITDSLQLKLERTTNDSIKAKLALKLAKQFRRTQPNTQKQYAFSALDFAKRAKDNKTQGIALTELASYYKRINKYDSATYYYKKSIPLFSSKNNIANAYSRLSNIEKAKGNFAQSIAHLITSDSLFQITNNEKGLMACNVNLGILMSMQNDHDRALQHYKKAEKYATTNKHLYGLLLTNFATTYNETDSLKKAEDYAKRAISINTELKNIQAVASDHSVLASVALKNNKPEDAITYYKSAVKGYKKVNNLEKVADSYTALGKLNLQTNHLSKAETYLLKANELAKNSNNFNAQYNNEASLYKLYQSKGNWQQANEHLNTYLGLKDSLIKIEKIKIIEALNTKFETDRTLREKELAETNSLLAQQKAKTSNNLSLAIAAISGLLLLSAFIFNLRLKNRKEKELLTLKLEESENRLYLEQQTRTSELKALQSQMNPHFLFNTLNSIQDLILLQDVRKSNKYLGKFSDLIRKILFASDKGLIAISDELDIIHLYTELELLRFGDSLSISINNQLSEDTNEEYKIPAMFIQPYIENALKHGLLHKQGNKHLSITFKVEQSTLVCTIADNGIGREKALQLKHKRAENHLGFSTKNNKKRLELLNQGRSLPISVSYMDNTPSGTVVVIKFPQDSL